jgi:hypothetical protein
VLKKVLRRKMDVMIEGRVQRMTIAEGVALQMVEQAGRGKIGALRFLMNALAQIEASEAQAAEVRHSQGITIPLAVDLLEVAECLLSAGVLYMRRDETYVFEESKVKALFTENPEFMAKARDLTFVIGRRAEDPEALEFAEGETLFDFIGRLL